MYITQKTKRVIAGIDIGKESLYVSVNAGRVRRFANTHSGIVKLLNWLRSEDVQESVCERSGGYERKLVSVLDASPVEVVLVHPNKVRSFARAGGYEAKTDELDAKVLSQYARVFDVRVRSEDEPGRESLKELLSRRRQLVKQRAGERNRLDKGVSAGVRASTERHIRWLDR